MRRIKQLFRQIKWRYQRSKKILPECDCWELHYTLWSVISQGLDYLVGENAMRDWEYNVDEKKERKDLELVRQWCKDYEYYMLKHLTVIGETTIDDGGYRLTLSQEDWDAFEKRQQKAFKILGKYFRDLWD